MGLFARYGGFRVPAVTFDVNDHLDVSSLTGIANGQDGTISVWLKFAAAGDATNNGIFLAGSTAAGSTIRVQIYRGSVGQFVVSMWGTGASPTQRLNMVTDWTTHAYGSGDGWLNLLASWRCDHASGTYLYVNDGVPTMNTGGAGGISLSNGTINYADTPYAIGGNSSNPSDTTWRFLGDMAELWFDPSYIDLSNSANRRKFISSGGKPVDLGATGDTPTGSTPLIYLKGPAANFKTNLGSGAGFTLTGALTDASTSPSD